MELRDIYMASVVHIKLASDSASADNSARIVSMLRGGIVGSGLAGIGKQLLRGKASPASMLGGAGLGAALGDFAAGTGKKKADRSKASESDKTAAHNDNDKGVGSSPKKGAKKGALIGASALGLLSGAHGARAGYKSISTAGGAGMKGRIARALAHGGIDAALGVIGGGAAGAGAGALYAATRRPGHKGAEKTAAGGRAALEAFRAGSRAASSKGKDAYRAFVGANPRLDKVNLLSRQADEAKRLKDGIGEAATRGDVGRATDLMVKRQDAVGNAKRIGKEVKGANTLARIADPRYTKASIKSPMGGRHGATTHELGRATGAPMDLVDTLRRGKGGVPKGVTPRTIRI